MGSIFLVSIFLSIGLVFGNPLSASGKKTNYENGLKIINGEFTTIDLYPINVAFLIANNIWGAGVIVDQFWILTTAFNCFWVDPSYITVRVGSSKWTEGGVILQAEKWVMHPGYEGRWANNIALVKLTTGVTFSNESRQGYYNPTPKNPNPKTLKIPGKKYDVTGWGVRTSSFIKESQLQKTSQTILSDEECNKFYNLTDATGSFCASNSMGGPCVFDFGAPMNRLRSVVGLYQGSTDCTKPDAYPALYVDVFHYISWIDSVIKGQ